IIDAHWLTAVTGLKSNDLLWDGRPAQYTVETGETVTAATSRVMYGSREIFLPAPGTYHLGDWTRRHGQAGAEYLIAWTDDRRFWMDTNQNWDFRDEETLADANEAPSYGRLPARTGEMPMQACSFVVAFDPARVPHVYSQDNADDHATMTTSTAVGSEFLGSSVGGVAPGARFVSALTGPGRSGVLEALILAARDKRVDIISASLSLETYPSVGNGF